VPATGKYPPRSGNWAKLSPDHDTRKVVSGTLSVLKWSGARIRRRRSKSSVQIFFLCPFLCKPGTSGVSLEPQDWKISPKIREIEPKLVKITMRARRSRLLFQSKWSGAIFRPRSSKSSVQIFFVYPFLFKPRTSGVSLESPLLENMLQNPGNRGKVAQDHDAR